MNVHSKIPSDIIGLTTPSPLSRRGFFMTASAAAAAGYTLAAGPVRAQVITTDTTGLKAGDATVKVAGGWLLPTLPASSSCSACAVYVPLGRPADGAPVHFPALTTARPLRMGDPVAVLPE